MKCGFESSGLKTLGMGVMLGVTSCVTTLPMTMSEGQVQAVRIWMDMGHKPCHVEAPRFYRIDERWFHFFSFLRDSGKGDHKLVHSSPLKILSLHGDGYSVQGIGLPTVPVMELSNVRDSEKPNYRSVYDCTAPIRAGPLG
ncbi:hypothetical protein LX69_03341 [Breznakibacter xylanolyticus]|uniref:Uncharacterized protein n=1 Tax=Breznakibacter xylanolyticus TaxID=990 RepID=A0A2W7PMK0_9BACT|nr:hypothetical protein [Breznakibacter xylanolyticus]PZX10569.1 hypothetical protein LX69_03341 [Breznakibacter xylanolyticus]